MSANRHPRRRPPAVLMGAATVGAVAALVTAAASRMPDDADAFLPVTSSSPSGRLPPAGPPPAFGHAMLEYFQLDPNYTNLNHGSCVRHDRFVLNALQRLPVPLFVSAAPFAAMRCAARVCAWKKVWNMNRRVAACLRRYGSVPKSVAAAAVAWEQLVEQNPDKWFRYAWGLFFFAVLVYFLVVSFFLFRS
jgi:hypothetical protein